MALTVKERVLCRRNRPEITADPTARGPPPRARVLSWVSDGRRHDLALGWRPPEVTRLHEKVWSLGVHFLLENSSIEIPAYWVKPSDSGPLEVYDREDHRTGTAFLRHCETGTPGASHPQGPEFSYSLISEQSERIRGNLDIFPSPP